MDKMKNSISPEEYERIGKEIESADSPVGIDARKTHIFILHKLNDIIERLERLEQKENQNESD